MPKAESNRKYLEVRRPPSLVPSGERAGECPWVTSRLRVTITCETTEFLGDTGILRRGKQLKSDSQILKRVEIEWLATESLDAAA